MHTSVQHDKFFINFNQQTFNLMKMVKTPWYGFACERVSDVWTSGMSTCGRGFAEFFFDPRTDDFRCCKMWHFPTVWLIITAVSLGAEVRLKFWKSCCMDQYRIQLGGDLRLSSALVVSVLFSLC